MAVGQFEVVASPSPKKGQTLGQVSLFQANGSPWVGSVPPLATAAELQAGTATAARVVSPKLISDEIKRQIAAIPKP